MNHLLVVIPLNLAAVVLLAGCRPGARQSHPDLHSNNRSSVSNPAPAVSSAPLVDACAFILAPHPGDGSLDRSIQRCQRDLRAGGEPQVALERLGWLYVSKARTVFDPGFYTLAEQCATCLEAKHPGSPSALLLRGHAWQSLHRFHEAEVIARRLVAQRGLPFDFGLLGDVLMEQGKLAEAIDAYQQMVNLKPDPYAYARIAHVRWLRGDLEGAIELIRMAAHGFDAARPVGLSLAQPGGFDATRPVGLSLAQSGGFDAARPDGLSLAQAGGFDEARAWLQTRRGAYEWQAGHSNLAKECCRMVLQSFPDYAPAHLLLGRILLGEGQTSSAVATLRRASLLNPLPEYHWVLIEALDAAGQSPEAREVEVKLARTGAANDPRTYALFLATRMLEPATALALAERELKERADVHTHDVLAWALAGAGRWEESYTESTRALAEGTADPRLYLHAGLIAARLGKSSEAQARLAQAAAFRRLLLPTEQRLLDESSTTPRTASADPL